MIKNILIITLIHLISLTAFCQDDSDKTVESLIDSAIYYEENKQYEQAAHYYSQAFKIDSDNYDIVNPLAMCYLAIGDFDNIIKYSNKLYEIDPLSPFPDFRKGAAYYFLKDDYETAIHYIDKVFLLDSIREDIKYDSHYVRAKAYMGLNKLDEAYEDLKVLYENPVPDNRFYINSISLIADIYFSAGYIENSLELYNQYIKDAEKPSNSVYFRRGHAQLILGDKTNSLKDFNRVGEENFTAAEYYALSNIFVETDAKKSIYYAEKGVQLDARYDYLFYRVLAILYYEAKEFDKALAFTEKVISMTENGDWQIAKETLYRSIITDEEVEKTLSLYYLIKGGVYFFLHDDYQNVIKFINKGEQISDEHLVAEDFFIRGSSYFETGNYPKALEDFDSVISEEPSTTIAIKKYAYRGICRSILEYYKEGIEDLTIYLESDHEDYRDLSFLFRAHSFFNSEKFDDCISDCKAGIELNKRGVSDLYFLIGKAFIEQEKFVKSEYYLSKYIDLPGKESSIFDQDQTIKETYYYLALSNYSVGEFEKSISYSNKTNQYIDKEDVLFSKLNQLLASSYFRLNQYDKAINYYTDYLSSSSISSSDNFMALYNRGISNYQLYDFENALSDFKMSIEYAVSKEQLKSSKLKLAKTFNKINDTASAREVYQELLKDSISFDILQEFVVFEINQGNLENSIELLSIGAEESIKRNHGSAAIAYFTSAMIKLEMGDKNGMIEDVNMALETDDYREGVETLYNSALSFRMMSLYNDSEFEKLVLKDAKRIMKEYPGDEVPYMITSLIHFRNKNFKKAMDVIKGYGKDTSSDTNVEFFKSLVYIYSQFSNKKEEGLTEREILLLERGEYKPFILLIKAVEKNQKEDFNSSCNLLDEFFMLVEGSQLRELKENNPLFKKLCASKLNSDEKHSLFFSLIEETLYFNLGIETDEDIF